ncbi:MAG: DUF4434 domain-containing protein [Candidatus Hydrogenedentes bacterium]|nr:DUF4434 domain-containing protein [Candidatus Hydrogenedentota bacterium]
MTRKSFLLAAGGLAASTLLGVETTGGDAPKHGTKPLLSGALRQYHPRFSETQGIDGWKRELDDEKAIGFDWLWLSNVPSALKTNEDTARLRELLDLCAERRVSAILDTGSSARWYIEPDYDFERALLKQNVEAILERYGEHPAFKAWYVPHEIYVAYDLFGVFMENFYAAAVELCKQATPNKPVSLSPFFILDQQKIFGDFRYAPPEEYGQYWARLIKRAGFDIIMLQDSGEHFSYVTNEQRRPFFTAMQSACKEAGAAFWGNVETAEFECPSIEEYVRRYGKVHHSTVKDAPWRPVPIERLKSKLALAAEYTERLVTWGYVEFCRPSLGPGAVEWYERYKEHFEAAG